MVPAPHEPDLHFLSATHFDWFFAGTVYLDHHHVQCEKKQGGPYYWTFNKVSAGWTLLLDL